MHVCRCASVFCEHVTHVCVCVCVCAPNLQLGHHRIHLARVHHGFRSPGGQANGPGESAGGSMGESARQLIRQLIIDSYVTLGANHSTKHLLRPLNT